MLGRWRTRVKHPSWGCRSFPDGPEVKNPPSNAGDTGSIPAWGTKIIQDSGQLRSLRTTTKNLHGQNLINKIIQPLSKCLFKKGALLPLLQACPHIQTPPHPFRILHPDHPPGVGDATACRSAGEAWGSPGPAQTLVCSWKPKS